jgi:hypothetical protein
MKGTIDGLKNRIKSLQLPSDWRFILGVWGLSRIFVVACLLVVAPALHGGEPDPAKLGWEALKSWDVYWYEKIVKGGYEYINDGEYHSVAFFPLFPLIIRGMMGLGITFEAAGFWFCNLTFLASFFVIYRWVELRKSKTLARWTIALLAWLPHSLYGTVIYTESLFLLLTTGALLSFEQRRYGLTALCTALASATRLTGILLVPSLLGAAWKEGRSPRAYLSALAGTLGLGGWMAFCWQRFGNPLVFLEAQKAWRPSAGFTLNGWGSVLQQIFVGQTGLKELDWGQSWTVWDLPWLAGLPPSIALAGLVAIALLITRYQQQLTPRIKILLAFMVTWGFWVWGGIALLKVVLVFGGLGWLIRSASLLSTAPWLYALLSYGVILNTGLTASLERYVYGIAPMLLVFAYQLSLRSWSPGLLIASAIPLAELSIRFARYLWVA